MDQVPDAAVSGLALGGQHIPLLLAAIPDAMIMIGEEGRVLSFSSSAEKMFGYDESEVIGENVSMLMPSPDRERHDTYLHNYRKTGVRKVIGIGRVTIARRRDGNTFPIELSVAEACVDGKRIFMGFIHDLTKRKDVETRLRHLQVELSRVGRISELGTLASSLAHELNQPLTAIASFCEGASQLLEGSLDVEKVEQAREALQEAADQAIRAGQIVKRMRDFLGHGDIDYRVENCARLIAEAKALALVGTGEYGIDVQVELDPACSDVFVDRIQIQQVLFNLLRNAIEAMLDGPVRSLITSCVPGPEGFVTVSVEDTGAGICEAVAPELFEPFVTSKQGGMGIGLSICRTIVEAHGGKIWFEPKRDGGTIFRFTIPKAEEEDEQL